MKPYLALFIVCSAVVSYLASFEAKNKQLKRVISFLIMILTVAFYSPFFIG